MCLLILTSTFFSEFSKDHRQLPGHADVSTLAPVGTPAVLHGPVVHALALERRVRAISDGEHAMIEIVLAISASIIDKDAVLVQHELVLGGIDGNADGSNSGERLVERVLIARFDVNVARARGDGVRLDELASALLALVRVFLLGREVAHRLNVVEGVVHETAIAALVVELGRAVDKLLLGERDELAHETEVSALEAARRAERPAATALTLVLDGRHGALLAPINALRCSGRTFTTN